MRPWPIVTIFRDAMHKALSGSVPSDLWELQPKPVNDGAPRNFTPIALKPIALASDTVLHSPMLARSVTGKAEVEAAVGLAHEIQSASSYTSIIATPDLLIELFDCDADGYPMEGIWLRTRTNPRLDRLPAPLSGRNHTEEPDQGTGNAARRAARPGLLGTAKSRTLQVRVIARGGSF
jgi:hypothetical protein